MNDDTRARWRLPLGAAVVLVLAALATTIAIGMFRTSEEPIVEVPINPVTSSPVAGGELYVHVAGAVRAPGLYRLKLGARVVDAVSAAGGFTQKAEPGAVNLAREVSDGEQLHVPRRGESAERAMSAGSAPGAPGSLVNLNTADAAALETLPRIGPALASRILEWREQNGRFTSIEDLLAVPGIGDKMLQALRDKVTV